MELRHPDLPEPIFLRRRRNLRRLTLSVGSRISVTAPTHTPLHTLRTFIASHLSWIHHALEKRRLRTTHAIQGTPEDYRARKHLARQFVEQRVPLLNASYGFPVRRLSIRNTRSRWGSCSARGTLTFHYRILDLSPDLQDYLIIHELCHLREPNHGPQFWALVAKTIPHFKHLRRALRAGIPPSPYSPTNNRT